MTTSTSLISAHCVAALLGRAWIGYARLHRGTDTDIHTTHTQTARISGQAT